jgi:sugar (pentulose or hexulose) kinase
MRTVYESLALKYRQSLNQQSAISGHTVTSLHVIGGGAQNKLLCTMTADSINRPVIAGPVEATALGNAVVQMITLGWIGSISEAREMISRSFPMAYYEPKKTEAWDDAYARFEKIVPN